MLRLVGVVLWTTSSLGGSIVAAPVDPIDYWLLYALHVTHGRLGRVLFSVLTRSTQRKRTVGAPLFGECEMTVLAF